MKSSVSWLISIILLALSVVSEVASLSPSTANYTEEESEVREPPTITEHPVSAVVARGQPVTLNCRASGRPPPRISWYHDGREVTLTLYHDGREVSSGRPDRLVLAPGSLFFLAAQGNRRERGDAGLYWCSAQNSEGLATSRNATLTVATLREVFRQEPESMAVTQGGQTQLECIPPRGHPEVNITWLKDGRPVNVSERVQIRGSDLFIAGTRHSDGGQYVCRAENALGARLSAPARLSVLVPPYFVSRPESAAGLAGQSLLLSCEAAGHPPPRVHWRRLRGPLPVGRLHYTADNSMRIDGLKPSDAGGYRCEAENPAGRVAADVSVQILVSPSVEVPAWVRARSGGGAVLQCRVVGRPAPRALWWREDDFDPLLTGQVRGRISISAQHDLQISPVTQDDFGWWTCGATSIAGSTTGRVLLTSSAPEKPLLSRSQTEAEAAGARAAHSGLDGDLVHLEELQIVRADSLRLSWKVSGDSVLDGFYICLVSSSGSKATLQPKNGSLESLVTLKPKSGPQHSQQSGPQHSQQSGPQHSQQGDPQQPEWSSSSSIVQRVSIPSGGADSYVLTQLRPATLYQVFLVPFRAGRQGRPSNLREVRLPEAAPTAPPRDVSASAAGGVSLVSWAAVAGDDSNGKVAGYTVEMLNVSGVAAPQRSVYNVSGPPLKLYGVADGLKVRVAAFTGAGVGPFSEWVTLERFPSAPVTSAVPLGSAGAFRFPTLWLVVAASCVCLAALGALVVTLHCRRLRAKRARLSSATAALYADVKIPVTMQDPKPDVLIRNTLWLRDELFHGAGSLSEPPACRLKKRSGDGSSTSDSDGHLYVNHLPVSQHSRSATDGTVSWRAHFVAGRYVGSNTASLAASKADTYEMSDQEMSESNTLRLDQLARQIASLRRQRSPSAPSDVAVSSRPVPSRSSLRTHRAPNSPLFSGDQQCCCYECDSQPAAIDSCAQDRASGRPTGTIFGTSLAPSSLDSSHSSHSHHEVHTSSATLAPSVVDRCTQSSLGSPTDGTTVNNVTDDVNSLSDSGSSLYAKTESNYSHKDPESPVSSDAVNELVVPTPSLPVRAASVCSADSAYGTPGPSRTSFSVPDGDRANFKCPEPTTGGSTDATCPPREKGAE